MRYYAVWYDNGTGFYEADELYEASSPQEALKMAGGSSTSWGSAQVVTASWNEDPNQNGEVLAC